MKITVRIGNEEKELTINAKGRDQKKHLQLALNLDKDDSALNEIINNFDAILIKSGLSAEEIDDMDLEELNKLYVAINNLLIPLKENSKLAKN